MLKYMYIGNFFKNASISYNTVLSQSKAQFKLSSQHQYKDNITVVDLEFLKRGFCFVKEL